jgi:tetratricopeptide (TPR) repeat protein
VLLLAGGLSAAVFRQSSYWENETALWQRAAACAPHSLLAQQTLAASLFAQQDYAASFDLYRKLLAENPGSASLNLDLGLHLAILDRLPEAEPYLQRAIQLEEGRGAPPPVSALYELARLRLRQGNLAEAEANIRRAIELRPYIVGYHVALAGILQREGKDKEAQEEMRRAVPARH